MIKLKMIQNISKSVFLQQFTIQEFKYILIQIDYQNKQEKPISPLSDVIVCWIMSLA